MLAPVKPSARSCRAWAGLAWLVLVLLGLGSHQAAFGQKLEAVLKLSNYSAGELRNGTLFCEVGDRIMLVVEISGEGAADASPPEAPAADGLRIEVAPSASSETTIFNGRRTQRTSYTVNCWPLSEGEFVFPELTVQARGDRLKAATNPVRIKVRKGVDLSDVVFVEAKTSRERIYIQQPFTITVKIRFAQYYYGRITEDPGPVIELPWMQEGKRFVAIGKAPEATRSSFIVATPKGGPRLPFEVEGIENDHVVLSYRQEYLAKEPGQFTIDPASFQCEVATKIAQGFFFQNQQVATQTKVVRAESPPLVIDVRPIPTENRPASFKDAVGKFDFKVEVPSTEVTVGESVKVRVQVSGTGNLDYLTMPTYGDLHGAGFREFGKRPVQREGSREVELELAPEDAHVKSVPKLEFSYFDPDAERFVAVERGPFPITVRPHPSGKVLTSVDDDATADVIEIHTIKEGTQGMTPVLAAWILQNGWLPIVPLLLGIVGAGVVGRHRRKLARDHAWARSRQALATFRERLREVDRARASGDQAKAYAALARALAHYVGDKLDHPGAGLVGDEAVALLKQAGVDAALIERLRTLFARCEVAHYAPAHALDGLDASQSEAMRAVTSLEEVVR